jgi:ribosomal protein S27AE
LDCPTCGYLTSSNHKVAQHREELETVWLFADPDPDHGDRLIERWHCSRCQPRQVEMVMCAGAARR